MKNNFEVQVEKITKTPNLPSIFKLILDSDDKGFFVPGEEILDTVFVERDGFEIIGPNIRKFETWTPATLVVITNFGISVLREAGLKISDAFYGYSIHHTVFDKIASICLDVCLLDGNMMISTATNAEPDTRINFNTAVYGQDFERIVGLIRHRIFLGTSRK